MNITPKALKAELDKVVIGQEEAKRTLSILVYNHYLRFYYNNYKDAITTMDSPPKLTGLIAGPTGSGKTLMIETLCDICGFPFIRVDATQLCMIGFSGTSILDVLKDLKAKYKGSTSADILNYSVVYIDEIDKLSGSNIDTKGMDHNRSIQSQLLNVIEGLNLPDIGLDTHKMLFLASGAFSEIYERRSKKANRIGFHSNLDEDEEIRKELLTYKELKDYGLMPELLGRLNVMTVTKKLSKEDIKKVIFDVHNSIYSQYQSIYFLSNTNLELTDDIVDSIVDKAHGTEFGMRILQSLIFDTLKEELFNLDNTCIKVDLIESKTKKDDNSGYASSYSGLDDIFI